MPAPVPPPPPLDAGSQVLPDPFPEPRDAGGSLCADAGPQLSNLDYTESPEVQCLSPVDFVDRHGRYHGTEVGFARASAGECPLATELDWDTGFGETCRFSPLCDSVEQRTLPTSTDGFECCYVVKDECGV